MSYLDDLRQVQRKGRATGRPRIGQVSRRPRGVSRFASKGVSDIPTAFPPGNMASGGDSMTPGLAPVTTREAAPTLERGGGGRLQDQGALVPYGSEGVMAAPEHKGYTYEDLYGSDEAGSLVLDAIGVPTTKTDVALMGATGAAPKFPGIGIAKHLGRLTSIQNIYEDDIESSLARQGIAYTSPATMERENELAGWDPTGSFL